MDRWRRTERGFDMRLICLLGLLLVTNALAMEPEESGDARQFKRWREFYQQRAADFEVLAKGMGYAGGAAERARDDYERSRWTNGAHYLESSARIKLTQRMVRQNDVGSKTVECGGKRFGRIDALYQGLHARPLQLVRNELCIGIAVLQEKNAEEFVRRTGCCSHNSVPGGR